MTDKTIKNDDSKSKFLPLLEKILFVCCIAVIVLRATSSEAPVSAVVPDSSNHKRHCFFSVPVWNACFHLSYLVPRENFQQSAIF